MEIVKYEEIKLSPSEALKIYTEKYPDTIVKEVQLELKSNSYLYKVKGYDIEKEYEIHVEPTNGTIVETKEKLSKRIYEAINEKSTDEIQNIVSQVLKGTEANSELYKWALKLEDGKLELDIKVKQEDGKEVEYEYEFGKEEIFKK